LNLDIASSVGYYISVLAIRAPVFLWKVDWSRDICVGLTRRNEDLELNELEAGDLGELG